MPPEQEEIVSAEPSTEVIQAGSDSSDSFRKAYEATANPGDPQEPTPEPVIEEESQPKSLTEEEASALFSGILAKSEESLQKQLRDANGKIGALFQKVEQMKATARPAAAKLTPGALKRLAENFPEMAGALTEDLAEIFTATPEPAEPAPKGQEIDVSFLNESHPDWQSLRDNPPDDYKEWLNSLRPSTRTRFITSDDPLYVAEKLDDYREWQSKSRKQQSAEPVASSRIENAVSPTNGTKPPAKGEPNPSERFRAAYKKAMEARF